MFGKRPDGRAIRDLEPMQQIMPYILKTRTDSMNMYEDTFACAPMDDYIKDSFFITNLKSLGINHIYHHVYEFGTTGLFFAMGKEKQLASVQGEEIVKQKHMGFGPVSDERFCDGLYFALSLRQLRKFMQNPRVLEEPLEKKVEDVK